MTSNAMSAEDRDNPSNPGRSGTSADHANRNRTQLEVLKLAVARKKHAAYIDAMLERRTRGEPASSPDRLDEADEKGTRPDS